MFLDRLTATLDLDQVTLHGLSMGGMAGLLSAAEHGRVERLVLVSSLLPAPVRGIEWFAWQTLGRLVLTVGPAVLRVLVRLWGRRLVDIKLRIGNPLRGGGRVGEGSGQQRSGRS